MSIISQLSNKLLAQRSLFVAQKRFNIRERIHRYVEPDKFKKHMLSACEPFFKRRHTLPEEVCRGIPNKKKDLHPLEVLSVKELLESLQDTDFILLIQYNFTPFQSERVYKNTIIKSGGAFHSFNNMIYRETFKTLNYADIEHLFIARNALVSGKIESLSNCVKALKKMPQLIFLCGFIDKKLYNVDQISTIATSGNIEQCRANLLATLTTPAIDLASNLQHYSETMENSQKELPVKENKP